jgi:GT2 family glycosyltransferase
MKDTVSAFYLVHGAPSYFKAFNLSIKSLLEFSDLDIFIYTDNARLLDIPLSERIRIKIFRNDKNPHDRAQRFLLKFQGVKQCLEWSDCSHILMLDVDTLINKRLCTKSLISTLKGRLLGMVEQTTIRGSTMSRKDFLEHYKDFSLKFINPLILCPQLEQFRFYNSGVVLAEKNELLKMIHWALDVIDSKKENHAVLHHMIADQDYFQVWSNNINPEAVTELSWHWNHCEHWDVDFPNKEASILHFSNFCEGPHDPSLIEMERRREQQEITYIIVTFNSSHCIRDCLKSLLESGVKDDCIIVFDNNSEDNTHEIVQRYNVALYKGEENIGFAKACNQAMTYVRTAFVCFLNPDCVLSNEVIIEAKKNLICNPEQVLAPLICMDGSDVQPGIQPGYTSIKLIIDFIESNFPHRTTVHRAVAFLKKLRCIHSHRWKWPLGTCMFTSTGLFTSLRGFNENYFLYMEDVDFGLKLKKQKIILTQLQSSIKHKQQTGSGISNEKRLMLLNHARLEYAKYNHGWLLYLFLISLLRIQIFVRNLRAPFFQ